MARLPEREDVTNEASPISVNGQERVGKTIQAGMAVAFTRTCESARTNSDVEVGRTCRGERRPEKFPSSKR